MKRLIGKLKGAGISFLILSVLVFVFDAAGVLNINPAHIGENTALFVLWWFIISLPIYGWHIMVAHRTTVLKISVLAAFLVLTVFLDSIFSMPDNPLTMALLTVFWLGVVYLVLPRFFAKYKIYLLTVYAFILGYFTYVRLSAVSFEVYGAENKETALLLFFLPIPLLIAVWAYEQWKWIRSLQTEKTNAELALLRTQINPHFFFNTLNNLYSLTVKQSDKAPEVILKLSDMMRYTIYEGEKQQVPIEEEIDYLMNYIDLHKIRYKKKVNITFEHDVQEGTTISPLLFIILLENAFKHGVESITEGAFVAISLMSDDEQIRFSIKNNYDPEEQEGQGQHQGIGLENLKRRLHLLYPAKHTLNITQEGDIFNVELTLEKR